MGNWAISSILLRFTGAKASRARQTVVKVL
jgi:hypothetical protein